jgi:hypothetical protein
LSLHRREDFADWAMGVSPLLVVIDMARVVPFCSFSSSLTF